MQVLRLPPRHHAKAHITCPPLRWRIVRRSAFRAGVVTIAGVGALALLMTAAEWWRQPLLVASVAAALACLTAGGLRLLHVIRRAREPVMFRVVRGELTVTWPFLFTRRTRTVRTSDVTGVATTVAREDAGGAGLPTARLVIRRRHRRPIRVPGTRPVDEVTRAAEELRAVLHV